MRIDHWHGHKSEPAWSLYKSLIKITQMTGSMHHPPAYNPQNAHERWRASEEIKIEI